MTLPQRTVDSTVQEHLDDHNTEHEKLNAWIDPVADFGAVGDGITDDWQRLQDALNEGLPVYPPPGPKSEYPNGREYGISRPLELTHDGSELIGPESSKWLVTLKCLDSFAADALGDHMVRNYSADPEVSTPDNIYPVVRNLLFDLNDVADRIGLSLAVPKERALIENLVFHSPGTDAIPIDVFSTGLSSIDGIDISRIVTYGGDGNWKHELRVTGSGDDVRVNKWTTTPGLHSASPFWFQDMTALHLSEIHCEAFTNTAGEAIFYFKDCRGPIIDKSYMSLGSSTTRPLLKATKANAGSGGLTENPVIRDLAIRSHTNFTGTNLIEDAAQGYDERNLANATYKPSYIDRYDGHGFWWREEDGAIQGNDVSDPQHILFRGMQNKVYTDANRPTAANYPAGFQIWNSDDNAPNWSDGTSWRDAAGSVT